MKIDSLSRRSFMEAALAGAAGVLIPQTATGADTHRDKVPGVPSNGNISMLSLSEASELVHRKKISPVELTKACLDLIERLNPKLNAFITVTSDSALAEAHAAEVEIQRGGWRGPLHGIPIALKDLVDTAGVRTTAASGLFKDRIPTQDAEIVRRLKAAGAVFLGKLNMHEFAYGASSVISYYGPVRNPWNPAYSTGGSSGGTASAVAAGLCYGAIGSDTGGSIRQPASFCGIVGLKSTYGRISKRGALPLAWSLDHLGPMTRTTADAALMLQTIAGYDPEDTTSINTPVPNYTAAITTGSSSLRIGIPRTYFYEDLHPDIKAAMEEALAVVKKITASQHEVGPLVSGESYSTILGTSSTVFSAEAYTYHKEWVSKSPELYQPETLKRILGGKNVEAAAYIKNRMELDRLRRSASQIFQDVDLLITPTSPVPPFPIADLLSDLTILRSKELLTNRNVGIFNALGLPAISVPCGLTHAGLPIGLQIIGPPGAEATVLRLACAYEKATDWHNRHPPVDI